jgi:hypothetical protein
MYFVKQIKSEVNSRLMKIPWYMLLYKYSRGQAWFSRLFYLDSTEINMLLFLGQIAVWIHPLHPHTTIICKNEQHNDTYMIGELSLSDLISVIYNACKLSYLNRLWFIAVDKTIITAHELYASRDLYIAILIKFWTWNWAISCQMFIYQIFYTLSNITVNAWNNQCLHT